MSIILRNIELADTIADTLGIQKNHVTLAAIEAEIIKLSGRYGVFDTNTPKPRRCSNHQQRKRAPRLCHVCARIAVEFELVARVVDIALKNGYTCVIENGEDEEITPNPQTSSSILGAMFETDDEYIILEKAGQHRSWVRFVYGNDGWDVISDYTTNLESIMRPIMNYASELY